MNTLSFSHSYSKFPLEWSHDGEQRTATLLEVLVADLDQLSPAFLQYDTSIQGGGNYPLKPGTVLVLLLVSGPNREVFTTIRSWNAEKERYYKALRGKDVAIKVGA